MCNVLESEEEQMIKHSPNIIVSIIVPSINP